MADQQMQEKELIAVTCSAISAAVIPQTAFPLGGYNSDGMLSLTRRTCVQGWRDWWNKEFAHCVKGRERGKGGMGRERLLTVRRV